MDTFSFAAMHTLNKIVVYSIAYSSEITVLKKIGLIFSSVLGNNFNFSSSFRFEIQCNFRFY